MLAQFTSFYASVLLFFFFFCDKGRFGHTDRWIDLLLRKGIKSLTLYLYPERLFYEVPSNLFDYQDFCYLELSACTLKVPLTFKGLQNLTTLKTVRSRLEVPPACAGFPSLRHLKVRYVSTEDDDGVLTRLISKCPLLERLTLEDTKCGSLEIHAPNLRYVVLNGSSCKDLSFGRCPLLVDVFLKFSIYAVDDDFIEDETCNLFGVLGSLHGIQRLEVSNLKVTFFYTMNWYLFRLE